MSNLTEARWRTALLTGGTSDAEVKDFAIACLRNERAAGSLLDFGAGRGELLARLAPLSWFDSLAGIDLFPRPDHLDPRIDWHQHDLDEPLALDRQFDCVVSTEAVGHLENPWHAFRCLHRLLKPGGLLVLTTPNLECVRSYAGLLVRGHYTAFLGATGPTHRTPLLRVDLERLCAAVGFDRPAFRYTNSGGIPSVPRLTWQRVSFGLLRGRLFSDTLAVITRKPAAPDPAAGPGATEPR